MKFCQEGNHEVPNLFWRGTKERKSACAQCARKYAKPISKTVKVIDSNNPLNKTLQSTKKNKSIPKVSEKQLLRLKEYRKVRDEYMKNNPYCQARLDYCQVKSTDLHHKAGKIGKLLSDERYFLAVCRTCHERIERHPAMAKELGLSLDRLTK